MSIDLESLNPQQREAVLYRGGPLLVLAGAGTGKTRVIVHRVAALIADGVAPERILAVTFTNKAAEEMRRRIDALVPGKAARIWVHTFHAFAARLLRRHAAEIGLTPHFTILDQDDQKRVVGHVLKDMGLEEEKAKAGLFVSVISRAKDDLLDAKSYAIYAMAQHDPFRETVAKVYEAYQRRVDAAGGLDFGDLLLKTAELLRQKEGVRDFYQKHFEHILIDEYQDTNHAQYLITRALAAQHRNLCVVGDPDQSIYAFRGADIRNILEFESDFQDTKVVRLEENYRSTPEILGAASAVIRNNKQRQEKTLWTKSPAGEPVEVRELADEREEARWIVGRIIRLLEDGFSLREIAVFYRTNAQSRQFEDALRVAQLPYRVVGSVRFYERKEIKDVLAYARAAANPADTVSLLRILNVPARGIGKTAEEALLARSRETPLLQVLSSDSLLAGLPQTAAKGAKTLAAALERMGADIRSLPPGQGLESVFKHSGYWEWLETLSETDRDAAGRLGNLQELLNAVKEYEEGREGATLEGFLQDVALQGTADTYDEDAQSVTLMTAHLAKGLEFPAVFVTGLEEGLFPISAGNSSETDLEEERRLCHVAMTRAKKRLVLTHASTRRLFGRAYANLPSRFILEAKVGGAPRLQADPVSGEAQHACPTSSAGTRSGAAPAAQQPPTPMLLRIKKGMRVRHPMFGAGRIVERSGAGESTKVTVVFDNGSTRKLLLRYAPLTPA
jgi:DNA helicase-2/ATP-dependent DNA helicase PcrA